MASLTALASASGGIQSSLQQMDAAAVRIANGSTASDLAADVVDLKTAQHHVAANAAVVRTADRMYGVLVDILA